MWALAPAGRPSQKQGLAQGEVLDEVLGPLGFGEWMKYAGLYSTKSNLRNDNRRRKKRVSAAKSDFAVLYPVSRRFRQPADSRVTARWSAVAGSFGLRRERRTASPLSGVPPDPCHK
jgi:hypothetical protein